MKVRIVRDVIACAIAVLFSLSSARGAVIHKDVGELTAESNRVVIGDVVEVTSFWNQDHTLIKSRIAVNVDDYIIGEGTGIETLEMSGGTVDDLTLRVSVLPIFEVGDHVLLFLGNTEVGLVGFFQGAYLTDGEQVAQMGAGCRQVLSETLRPLNGLLSEIEQSLPPGVRLPEVTPYDGDFDILLYVLCGRDWTYQSNPMGESYKINANCADGPAGSPSSQRTQIQYGATVWNDVGAGFEFTYGGTSTQTVVAYNGTNLVYFDTTPPDGGGYLAATYSWFNGNNILECDLVYDDQHWTWWNGSGSCYYPYFDIRSVAAHEFGHFLCLGHSSYRWATMWAYVDYCETHMRTLLSDDINGIIAIYGIEDITPPEPDPMSFESPPTASGTVTIIMTASLATDATPPVEYQFDFVSGGPGGSDRNWGSTRPYTDYSLTQNTEYSYRCRARDGASPPNETQYSSILSAFTLANIPGAPALSNVTINSIDLDVDPNENPNYTPFAVLCASTDPAWDGMFVNASGDPAVSEEWQTDDQWGTVTILGLSPETEYSFQVKALNGDDIETGYGPQGTETTLPDTEDITPPEPDPMTFESPPTATDTESISMTATLATDDTQPVEYEFDFVSGGPGGSDRSWGSTRPYTDYSLTQNTEYSYRCRARDGASPPNETQYSSVLSAFTLANIPGAPALSNVTSNSIDLDVDPNENPNYTPFAVLCATSDPAWDGMFVNASGAPAVSEEWQTDDQWGTVTILGLSPETEYSFQVKALNGDDIETGYGPQSSETTLPDAQDITPPEPDPMTFESPPTATDTESISMTATLATDDTQPVEYEFDFVSGGPGGSDRSWGSTRPYTDYSLTQNTEYSYRCRARDGASPPNETAYSSVLSAFTLANIPGAPALSNVTSNSIDLDVDPNENPSYTPFAVLCATSDPAWDGMFVNASGDPAVSEEWQTDDQWGTVTIQGLSPETEYSFQVKARNGDGIETEYGPQSMETTLPGEEVPTLSEWGMLIMALLLLAVGTIAVIRGRSKLVARTF